MLAECLGRPKWDQITKFFLSLFPSDFIHIFHTYVCECIRKNVQIRLSPLFHFDCSFFFSFLFFSFQKLCTSKVSRDIMRLKRLLVIYKLFSLFHALQRHSFTSYGMVTLSQCSVEFMHTLFSVVLYRFALRLFIFKHTLLLLFIYFDAI